MSGTVKYLLAPGYVESKHDGDLHWIGAGRLARLYGVRLADCKVLTERDTAVMRSAAIPVLRPRRDGKYALPAPEAPR